MKHMDDLRPLKQPTTNGYVVNPNTLVYGPLIDAQKIVSLYSPDEYERFTEEWASEVLEKKYKQVRRLAGANDMGRDIVAYLEGSDGWVNYQCKHYNNPLTPSDVWVEIGKILFHSFTGDITLPQEYYFVAPEGIGPKLSDLLDDPTKLKQDLIGGWSKECANKITKKHDTPLSEELRLFIEGVDFSIFKSLSPLDIVKQFQGTRGYSIRFGGGLPNRTVTQEPDSAVQPSELGYVSKLLEAYSEHAGLEIASVEVLKEYPEYESHLYRQRKHYFSAESLMLACRDSLPEGTNAFDGFLQEVHDGIIDRVEASKSDGYTKVIEATETAALLPLSGNALRDIIWTGDKKGACHHLAKDDRVSWANKKNDK
jgi:hypothetical protein